MSPLFDTGKSPRQNVAFSLWDVKTQGYRFPATAHENTMIFARAMKIAPLFLGIGTVSRRELVSEEYKTASQTGRRRCALRGPFEAWRRPKPSLPLSRAKLKRG